MTLLKFFRSPRYAMFAVSIWMVSFLVFTSSQVQSNFSYLVLLLPTLFTLSFSEVRRFFSNHLSVLLLSIIASLVVSAYFKDGDPISQVKFGLIVLLFFISVARLPLISNELAYKTAWFYLGLLIIYTIFNMIWFYHLGTWFLGKRMGEMVAKLENVIYVTNTMGGMLAIITFVGIQAKRYRGVLLAHCLVLIFTLTILQTRSILIIWSIILLISYLSLAQDKGQPIKHKALLLWTAGLGLLSIALLLGFTNIGESLLARNFYRPEIWQSYIAETLKCGAWLGCGPTHIFQYTSHDGQLIAHPHSVFVTQFYKAGILGITPLLILAFSACFLGYRQRSWAGWYFIAGVIGVCIDGSNLIHSPSQRWLIFHLPLALLIAQQLNHATKIELIKSS